MALSYPVVTRSTRTQSGGIWRAGHAPWPHGARCVVTLTIDFDGTGNEIGKGLEPFGAHSAGRYSARRGIPRHLGLLDRLGVPATFFVPGYDAQCSPDAVRSIAQAGHEIGAHGYVHEGVLLPPDEETRRLKLTHSILGEVLGRAPLGWRSPSGQKTAITLPVLSELGYQYDASDKDSDMPYMLDLGQGEAMVEIPNNTYSLDDFPWFSSSMTPVSEVVEQWKEEFDAIYASRGYFMLTVHPRSAWGSGSPRRSAALEETLRHIQRHSGVRFLRLKELSDWVRENKTQFEEVRV